ncbi:hypothetical protein [Burkholderia sp. 3C]
MKPARHPLQRLLAIVAFLAGGFAAELAHPHACHTVGARGLAVTRRREARA